MAKRRIAPGEEGKLVEEMIVEFGQDLASDLRRLLGRESDIEPEKPIIEKELVNVRGRYVRDY